MPCEMVEEEYPLASNAWYREDLQEFIKGDYDSAQMVKDNLEEKQRADRKLRERKAKP